MNSAGKLNPIDYPGSLICCRAMNVNAVAPPKIGPTSAVSSAHIQPSDMSQSGAIVVIKRIKKFSAAPSLMNIKGYFEFFDARLVSRFKSITFFHTSLLF